MDMLDDLRRQIEPAAEFPKIEAALDIVDGITELCTFASMKANATTIDANSEENL